MSKSRSGITNITKGVFSAIVPSIDWMIECLEAVTRRCSLKKVFLKSLQNSKENTCIGVSWPEACNFIEKETPTRVFSSEFCEIFKTTFLL